MGHVYGKLREETFRQRDSTFKGHETDEGLACRGTSRRHRYWESNMISKNRGNHEEAVTDGRWFWLGLVVKT